PTGSLIEVPSLGESVLLEGLERFQGVFCLRLGNSERRQVNDLEAESGKYLPQLAQLSLAASREQKTPRRHSASAFAWPASRARIPLMARSSSSFSCFRSNVPCSPVP